ncbi:hypothetical protein Tco_0344472 [Tanacetum coccineum]
MIIYLLMKSAWLYCLLRRNFLRLSQTRREQNQPEVMQELLLKLINDLQILKGSQQENKKPTTQSSIPYWNSSMIDDEEARDNFLKDKFSEYINCPSWNRPLFYFDDDDDEYTVIWRRPKAITPDEPSEDPEDPLIMGEKELSTIPEKDKSSVEDLVPILSRSKGVSDDIYDHSDAEPLLSKDNPITSPKIDFLSEEFAGEFVPIPPGMDEDKFDEEEDDCYNTTSDDDSYESTEYVEASSLNLEYDNVILREKLLNVHRLITNIESLKNNPTPDFVFKSPSSFPIPVVDSDSFFEESDTSLSHSDNSLPEFETFSDHKEETRSGSTTTHANNSLPDVVISDNSNDPLLELPEFESFHFDLDPSCTRPPPEPPDVKISLIIETDALVIKNFDELNEDECFDPGELNEDTRKDHFPLPFMDQMLERLTGNDYYCFLDGFSGYFQIPIDPKDQEKTTFTFPYGTFAYRRMPFELCNAPGTFQRCMMAIFHDMIEKTMEVGTDKAKTTRKQLKPGKHEYGNGRAHKESGGSYQNQNPSQSLGLF